MNREEQKCRLHLSLDEFRVELKIKKWIFCFHFESLKLIYFKIQAYFIINYSRT